MSTNTIIIVLCIAAFWGPLDTGIGGQRSGYCQQGPQRLKRGVLHPKNRVNCASVVIFTGDIDLRHIRNRVCVVGLHFCNFSDGERQSARQCVD